MVMVATGGGRNGRQQGQPGQTDEKIVELERAPVLDEPALTRQWIETQLDRGRQHFAKFRSKCREADEFFLSDFTFSTPDDGTMIRLGTAESVVKSLVQHVTPQFLEITVPPRGPRGQSQSERLEKFLRGAAHMLDQETPTRRLIAQHMGLYGIAWEKLEFAANRWGDFPEPPEDGESEEDYRERLSEVLEDREIKFPFLAGVVNPQMIVWDTQNKDNPRWVIAEYEVAATWVKAHFPDWTGPTGGDVQFLEAWTHDQVAYLVEKDWALPPREHGYGKLPWTMYWPQTGLVTVGNKPEHLYRGMLHGNFEMIRAESRLASHFLDIVATSAWPVNDFQGPPGLTEQVASRYNQTPGARNVLPPNVVVNTPKIPEPPQSIIIAKEMLGQAIDTNTAPEVVRGVRPRGASSGFETAVLSGIAALNFEPYVAASQRGMQKRNELMLRIVENVIQDRVTVWGKTEAGNIDASISPRDIRGHYVNFVELNPTSPEEQERRLNIWAQRWREGFVDHDTALRRAGVSNALEVRAKLLAEKFLQSEQVQALLAQEAAERVPLLSEILDVASGGGSRDVNEIAQRILDTQGEQQLRNPGNFSSGNQPQRTNERDRVATQTRPVIPGSAGEADLIAREITLPRGGNRRVPTSDLPPGQLR